MEFILKNTDIFDISLRNKFDSLLKTCKEHFEEGKPYNLTMSFHVNLIQDPRKDKYEMNMSSKVDAKKHEDRIYEIMSTQLDKVEEIMTQNGIESYSLTIQGDNLDYINIIKFDFEEDKRKPAYSGRGKSKTRIKVRSIAPNAPGTRATAAKFMQQRLNKLFSTFYDTIRNKEILSEVLEVEKTNDVNVLYKAFVNQYWELGFTTSEREKELLEQLKGKCLAALEKHQKETDKNKLD